MGEPRYREYPIRPALASFIKCIWSLESGGPVYDALPERILPDGCVEMVFRFHDPFRTHFANGESTVQPQSFVVGQMRRFLEIAPAGRMGFVAVRFSARNAYRFFPGSLHEVADGVVDLTDIWKQNADEWTDRIAFAGGMNERVRIVEQVLVEALCKYDRADRLVDRRCYYTGPDVLITAGVATLGLIPMLFATGPGSEIQKPLAAVVIGGLLSSTLLTLFILPTLYNVFERSTRPAPHSLPDPASTKEVYV